MSSRFVFELVIWPQEVTLATWTQPSGPLFLWQCLISKLDWSPLWALSLKETEMKAWKRLLECPLWGLCPLPQWLGSSKDSLMLSSPGPDLDLARPLLRLDLVEGRRSAWSGWVWACRYLYLFTLGWKHINLNGSEVTRGATSLLDGNTSTPTQPTHSRIHNADSAQTEYCSTFPQSVRVSVTGVTSHIYPIYKGINAMLIIRGPIKPYIFWIKIILAIFLAKTRPKVYSINAESALFTLSCFIRVSEFCSFVSRPLP